LNEDVPLIETHNNRDHLPKHSRRNQTQMANVPDTWYLLQNKIVSNVK
jgi:hypothetical protein